VRIPDELRECVCFVQASWASGDAGVGTAFFVGIPLEVNGLGERWFHYAITARHVISDVKRGPAETAVLLVNTRQGGRAMVSTRVSEWLFHETADIAVFPVGNVNPAFQVSVWDAARSIATEKVVREKNIGAGDDVFIAGLLVHHPGITRNLPIVRLGAIAAMPEDPVALTTGVDVVTLAEVHSIGGLSGSPVFVHLSVLRDAPAGKVLIGGGASASSGGSSWLHGVMHGFYPVGKSDLDNVSGGDENLNTGIAVVVRIDRALDLIHRPDQIAIRDEVKRRMEQENETTPVPTSGETRSEEFERFEALTRDLFLVPKAEVNVE
jgi:hypothetical protein